MLTQGHRTDAVAVPMGAHPIEVRPDGSKVYRGTAAFGDVVKRYPDLVPPRNEFVPADELMAPQALAQLQGLRFTAGQRTRDYDGRISLAADHRRDRRLDDPNAEEVDGVVLRGWRHDAEAPGEPPELKVDVLVYSRPAQDLLERGVCDLSFGFRTDEERVDGEHGGVPYQYVQRNIRYYHLNLVRSARSRTPSGRSARLDSYPHSASDKRNHLMKHKPLILAALAALSGDDAAARTDADALSLPAEDAALMRQMSPATQEAMTAALGLAVAEPVVAEAEAEELEEGDDEAAEEMAEVASDEAQDAALLAPVAAKVDAILAALAAAGIDVKMAAAASEDAAPAPAPDPDGAPKLDADAALRVRAIQNNMASARQDSAAVTKPTAPAARPTHSPVDAKAVIAAAEQAARAAASAQFAADAGLVGAVRVDGHDEVSTPAEAAVVMLTTIKTHLPGLAEMADEMVKGQRLDSLVPLYKQAESIRREALTSRQGHDIQRVLASAAIDATGATGTVVRRPNR